MRLQVAIDGIEVNKSDIIPKLRGNDVPGSSVKVSVLKKDQEHPVDFTLTRADMRSVMNLKDLYLALGEIHTELDTPRPERLKQKVEILEKRIQVCFLFWSLKNNPPGVSFNKTPSPVGNCRHLCFSKAARSPAGRHRATLRGRGSVCGPLQAPKRPITAIPVDYCAHLLTARM